MLEPLDATRLVATPEALDAADWSEGIVMRTAPDEVLLIGGHAPSLKDPHAIIESDAGWVGAWLNESESEALFRRTANWTLPTVRPVFAQGMVSHLPVKLWLEADRVLWVVPRSLGYEFEHRAGV